MREGGEGGEPYEFREDNDTDFLSQLKKEVLETQPTEMSVIMKQYTSAIVLNIPQQASTYEAFCYYRKQCDTLWKEHKYEITEKLKKIGCPEHNYYKVFQSLSYQFAVDKYTQKKGYISIPDIHFYNKIPKKSFGLRYKNKGFNKNLVYNSGKYKPIIGDEKSGIYNDVIKIDSRSIDIQRLGWQEAQLQLENLGCSLRSSQNQHEEIGEKYDNGNTCLQGITQETIIGFTKLQEHIRDKHIDGTANLVINGGTEHGHANDKRIVAGEQKEHTHLSQKSIESHGMGFALDIRLIGEEGIAIKKTLPAKNDNQQYVTHKDGFVYLYRYHGGGNSYHLHLNVLSEQTYSKVKNTHIIKMF